ncbi:hypothetical protein SISSUDRAFT_1045381 [Sistotremastrum suecicum HHB10207 ss-3]|uniref:Uncharacterized protein n=1 Tax=Sistotremastrum suecicum HHB10207 ss-3 TaxID=1314776 RepID=A0A166EF62_9AGAM|nr:hypothetical protein SISSUDRAFT_1045381 [Sistotremastrum suecicum HHB10207 ss-3]
MPDKLVQAENQDTDPIDPPERLYRIWGLPSSAAQMVSYYKTTIINDPEIKLSRDEMSDVLDEITASVKTRSGLPFLLCHFIREYGLRCHTISEREKHSWI